MTLKSNAVSGELTSPFYIRNKEFCEEYEEYITSLGGKIYGSFNSWSYNVLGFFNENELRNKEKSIRLETNLV